MENPIEKVGYTEIKEAARAFYLTIGQIYCPPDREWKKAFLQHLWQNAKTQAVKPESLLCLPPAIFRR